MVQRRADQKRYWLARARGLSSAEAKRLVYPGQDEKNQAKWVHELEQKRPRNRRNYMRWGARGDFKARYRAEMIRSGEWKEEEHSL